ncbi:hypothetical protein [Novosphingobium soli]
MTSPAAHVAFPGIRPTSIERQRGRLLRAPDHDAGTAEAPAPSPSPAPAATEPPAADQAPPAPAGEAEAAEAETSLLGDAVANKDGAAPTPQSPADPQAPADRAAETPPAPEHVVPEAYELSVEGLELDATAVEEATPVFKELGLSNEQANKLMPEAAKFRDRVANSTLQGIVDAGARQKADWAEATRSDPELGGARLEETLHLSAKALDALGFTEGHEFRQALTDTGFGNHPGMARVLRSLGEMISEDGFPRSGAGASTLSAKDILYPKKGD